MTLITGGTGFIGSHLVETLCARNEPVRCLLRRDSAKRHRIALPSKAEVIIGNLISGEGLEEALRGADTVIHLAGITKALSISDYYAGNVRATENLARALRGRGIQLVHVSSLAAIGPAVEGKPVSEDDQPHPMTHYGRSKLEGERVVRELVPEAVIVRPPVVYGPRDTDVFQMFKSISKGLVVRIAGGERWFQAIFVKDLVEGLIAAARAPQAQARAYFLAHATPVSWTGFSDTSARVMGKHPRVLGVPPFIASAVGFCAEIWSQITRQPGIVSREKVKEARCLCWTCDTSRAARELGFEARTPLETGLAETLAWYKEAGWLTY